MAAIGINVPTSTIMVFKLAYEVPLLRPNPSDGTIHAHSDAGVQSMFGLSPQCDNAAMIQYGSADARYLCVHQNGHPLEVLLSSSTRCVAHMEVRGCT